MAALENGHLDIVKTLIEAGANVNQSDKVCVGALFLYSIYVHTLYCLGFSLLNLS